MTPPPAPLKRYRITVDIETHDNDRPRILDQVSGAIGGSEATRMATQIWVSYPQDRSAGVGSEKAGSEKARPKRSDYRKMLRRLTGLLEQKNAFCPDTFVQLLQEAKRLSEK